MTAPLLPPAETEQPEDERDEFAFWRGLAVGLCLSGCFWIALAGGLWAALGTSFTGSR